MTYLMESEREGARLSEQESANPSRQRLRATGLRAGMRALDAGCGAGAITETMADLVEGGEVVGIDQSLDRLAEARRLRSRPNVTWAHADICSTGLESGSFDYIWSQFVFEYLPEPRKAVAELARLLRPGGKLVVSDVDGAGLANFPFPEALEAGYRKLLAAVAHTGFDLFIGRKLFHLMKAEGLGELSVSVHPLYVAAGRADDRLVQDWALRFEALASVAEPAFGGREAYRAFAESYLALLRDEEALKFSLVLVTEGVRR